MSVAVATNDASVAATGEARAPLAEMEDIETKKRKEKPAEVQLPTMTFLSLLFRVRH